MRVKTVLKLVFITILSANFSNAQMLPSLALSGGPSAGWYFINVNDLNAELTKAGFPELSKDGFFTLGGGGFIDLPMNDDFLRIGGMGTGFETNKEHKVNDSLTKSVTYNFGMAGLSVEYVKDFGNFDIFFGALFTTGTLKLDLYQYGKDAGNYNSIFGVYTNDSSSVNVTHNFKVRFFGAQPQLGIGLLVKKFFYLKLSAGYYFGALGSWKVDNDIKVTDFPEDVKPNGFNISLGLNFGLFFRD